VQQAVHEVEQPEQAGGTDACGQQGLADGVTAVAVTQAVQ
jgi:hypothetical protein